MANFRIPTKKILSEQNISKIIMTVIGLRDEMEDISKELIEDYDSTKTYSPNMACYYNDYLYRCLFTTTGEFDINSWKKVGDSLELVNKAQVEAMLGLTQEQLETLASIILDSEVRLDKTFSSSRIFSDMQDILSQSKKFTLEEFAKANKASYTVTDSVDTMTDQSTIYLLKNDTTYDMYIVQVDGTPTKIGDVNIDLTQFYTKTEIDNDFVKKTDADGKYATITTVDGKVDKTSILSTISSNPSDDKLLSEKAVNDTLVKKTDIVDNLTSTDTDKPLSANQGKILNNKKVDKTSILTAISASPSDNNLLSEKAIDTNLNNLSQGILVPQTTTMNKNILLWDVGHYYFNSNATWREYEHIPSTEYAPHVYVTSVKPVKYEDTNNEGTWFRQIKVDGHLGKSFIRTIYTPDINDVVNLENGKILPDGQGTDTGWQRICTTSVADVEKTSITSNNTNLYTIGSAYYCVKNGICYINFWPITVKNVGSIIKTGKIFPKPLLVRASGTLIDGNGKLGGQAYIGENGELRFDCILANTGLYCTLSYPVENS